MDFRKVRKLGSWEVGKLSRARRSSHLPIFPSSQLRSNGTVLLLAVLVMTAVVTTSVGLGSLIMSALAQSRIIDNSIVGYYAAESGAEQALYAARRLEQLPPSVPAPVSLSNNATWTRTVTNTEPVLYTDLSEDQFVELDLYDPSNETVASGIARLQVEWTDGAGASVRMMAIPWTPSANFTWDQNVQDFTYTSSPASISLDPAKLYKLRLRARGGNLSNVRISAFDSGDAAVDLPGRIKIHSLGEYGGVRQALDVTLPSRTPLSSLYDFVIFSECSLVKGGGSITCP